MPESQVDGERLRGTGRQEMAVRVDEAGNQGFFFEIDHPGVRPGQCLDVAPAAYCLDAAVAYGYRFRGAVAGVHRQYLAVEVNRVCIRGRILHGSADRRQPSEVNALCYGFCFFGLQNSLRRLSDSVALMAPRYSFDWFEHY